MGENFESDISQATIEMTPIGQALTALMALMVLLGSRRWAALSVIAATCYITQGQQVDIGGFHFTAIRIVLLAGIARCLARGELRGVTITGIDKAVFGYVLIVFSAYTARERTSQAFVYMLGYSYDILLSYVVFRFLVANLEEAMEFVRGLAFLIIPFALLMLLEYTTGHNVFRVMGGQGWDTVYFREDRVRCLGSFRGPHSAGIFGATMFPLFASLWFARGMRVVAVVGLLASATITITSNSSGPLLGFLSGLVGLLFWRFRRDMKSVRWGIVGFLIASQLMMTAPVWYIFAKMAYITGGDGYTRSYVINQAVSNVSQWWLVGTSKTKHWMGDPDDTGHMDVTNHFVAAAINGGLLALIFYILIIVRCFRQLGSAGSLARGEGEADVEKFMWCLGAALLAHIMSQFTVSYFDQILVVWWGLIAIISGSTAGFLSRAPENGSSAHTPVPSPANDWDSIPAPTP